MKNVFKGEISKECNIPIVHCFCVKKEANYFYMDIDIPTELTSLFQIYVVDSNNVLRLQHLIAYSKRHLVISKDKSDCSIGAYPGEICNGMWKLFIVTDNESLKDKIIKYSIKIETTDVNVNKKINSLGEDLWVDYKKENSLLTLNKYNWDKEISKESRWYKGDFHTHSKLSDGKMDNKLYMKTAEKMKLDFAVITEHNILPTGWTSNDKILVIPGIEITFKDGHFNILGAKKFPIDMIDIDSKCDSCCEIVNKILLKNNNKQSIYSVNHPFLKFWMWKFKFVKLKDIDTIEICNDPTYYLGEESNNETIKLIDILWNDGYRIWGIGGSDSHILPNETYENSEEPSIIGDPATYVYSNKLTAKCILNAVKKGNMYVSRGLELDISIKGRERSIELKKEFEDDISEKYIRKVQEKDEESIYKTVDYLPGSEVNITKEITIDYEVKVKEAADKNNKCKIKAYLIENGKIIEEKLIENGSVRFSTIWAKNEFKWIRVELRTLDNKFKAYINPIYHGYKQNKLETFENLFNLYNS